MKLSGIILLGLLLFAMVAPVCFLVPIWRDDPVFFWGCMKDGLFYSSLGILTGVSVGASIGLFYYSIWLILTKAATSLMGCSSEVKRQAENEGSVS